MVDIPPQQEMTQEQAFQRLQDWYQKQQRLNTLKAHEHLERTALSEYYFRTPREGTNRLDIGGGFDLKLVHGYNYKVSEEDLDNVKAADIKKLKLPWDDLFRYKPELVKSVYNDLTPEQKKFVDGILDITPSSPQLHIVPQADKDGQAKHKAAAEGNASAGASASPAADSPASDDRFTVVLKAEDAEPGHYYNDGETWWQLNAEIEWDEVNVTQQDENGNDLGPQLDAIKAQLEAAKPKRRTRKAK